MISPDLILNSAVGATGYVAEQGSVFDTDIADLLVRNTAVLAERLGPQHFSKLGTLASDAMLDAAAKARDFAPLDEADKLPLPDETAQEHMYRTQISGPFQKLASVLRPGGFDISNATTVAAAKRAVALSTTAFEAIIDDPVVDGLVEIESSMAYFFNNAVAAAKRADLLQSDHR